MMIEAQYLDNWRGFIGIDLFGIPDVYDSMSYCYLCCKMPSAMPLFYPACPTTLNNDSIL